MCGSVDLRWEDQSHLGPTIAPPLLTVLMISFGWRWMFVSMGLLGIAVAIMWYTVYREVAEAALSPGEAHHLTEGEEEPPPAQHVTLAEFTSRWPFNAINAICHRQEGCVYRGGPPYLLVNTRASWLTAS